MQGLGDLEQQESFLTSAPGKASLSVPIDQGHHEGGRRPAVACREYGRLSLLYRPYPFRCPVLEALAFVVVLGELLLALCLTHQGQNEGIIRLHVQGLAIESESLLQFTTFDQ